MLDRARSAVVGVPGLILRSINVGLTEIGPAGSWIWYPLGGTFLPAALGPWFKARGAGCAIAGDLVRDGDTARFDPCPYWQRRGVEGWEVEASGESQDGDWLRIDTARGSLILCEY